MAGGITLINIEFLDTTKVLIEVAYIILALIGKV